MICADPGRVRPKVFQMHVELSEKESRVPDYSRSILRMLASLRFDPSYRTLECPVCILRGDRDWRVPVAFLLVWGSATAARSTCCPASATCRCWRCPYSAARLL